MRRRRIPQKAHYPQYRVNHMIRVPRVRLIDENGEQHGVVPTQDARIMARDRELDLVEISPNADPPVCRIMDFGKFKYEAKKKAHESKKKQHTPSVKELRLRPNTSSHDAEVKMRKAREFLEDGDKVSFTVRFRGREVVHSDAAVGILQRIAQDLNDIGKIERAPRLDGKRMTMVVSPYRR